MTSAITVTTTMTTNVIIIASYHDIRSKACVYICIYIYIHIYIYRLMTDLLANAH